MQTTTQREFAAKHGVATSTVLSWRTKGWLIFAENGRLDVERSEARLRELGVKALTKTEANPLAIFAAETAPKTAAKAKKSPEAASPYAKAERARARKLVADAKIAELKLARMIEEVVDVVDVTAAWVEILGSLRNALRAIPARIAGELAARTSEHDVRTCLEREIDEVLRNVSETDTDVPLRPTAKKSAAGRKKKA